MVHLCFETLWFQYYIQTIQRMYSQLLNVNHICCSDPKHSQEVYLNIYRIEEILTYIITEFDGKTFNYEHTFQDYFNMS